MLADVTFASSVVGILSPVLTTLVLIALRSLANKQHARSKAIENSITEVEDTLGNGIKTVLDNISEDTHRDKEGKQIP
jgi:hypothetical protein